MNGSIIKIEPNDQKNYGIISIYGVNNVSISNGILIGDRYEHIYTGDSNHAFGMGIDIRGSQDISISNVYIYNMIGDGIFIDQYKSKKSNNININNCTIYNNRRQGITVTTADNVHIINNEIYNINEIAPSAGICLEKNYDTQIIKNIYIYHNKFYNCKSKNGVYIYSNVEDIYIDDNEIYGNIYIEEKNNTGNDTIHIGNNTFKVAKQNDYSRLTTDLTNTFTDINLKNAILELVGKEENDNILESDIAKIASDNIPGGKQLNLANKGINNLNGIEIFAKYNIEWLYLDNNNITDLTPISSFTSLTKLNASNNNITDISTLENLTKLKTVNLTNNKIKDISVLKNSNNLEFLYLNNNKINGLDCLSNINTIREIYCSENEIESIDNIINLYNLEKLDVRKNKIKNVLTKVTSEELNYLNLSQNRLLDITGLMENNINNLDFRNQDISLSTGQVFKEGYIQINLPKIFNIIDDTYELEVINISNYELKDNYSSIVILAEDFINKGLNIKISKDNDIYFNYSMKIDNSINETLSKKFNIIKSSNEYLISGININNNSIKDFIEGSEYKNNYTITFYRNDKILNLDEDITTGTIMRVYDFEKEFYEDYTVILYGDINGDGKITSLDALDIVSKKINNYWENININSAYAEAGRVSDKTRKEKSIPSSVDALAVVKSKLGTYNIKQ